MPESNHETQIAQIEREYRKALAELLTPVRIEHALLCCSQVLSAKRVREATAISGFVARLGPLASPFLLHLAAREIILYGTPTGGTHMKPVTMRRLLELIWDRLDCDPAMRDPAWQTSDPTGWAIRYIGLQENSVGILKQLFGLALALFTSAVPRGVDEVMDIPSRLAAVLGMSAEMFMRAGFMAFAIRATGIGNWRAPGTISDEYVAGTTTQIGPELANCWRGFAERTATDPAAVRSNFFSPTVAQRSGYELFRFNDLRRFPLIDIGGRRFIAPDPDLLLRRTTLGMYFDLLEVAGEDFTRPFGYRVANLVGTLVRAACGQAAVWSENQLPKHVRERPPSRNVDHAFSDSSGTVLIECKAMRPSSRLLSLGGYDDVTELKMRLAGAIEQVGRHAEAMARGAWCEWGLPPNPCCGVVVTYGKVPTVNGLLFRDHLARELERRKVNVPPCLILSLEEFDSLMRLVELGNPLPGLVRELATSPSASFPGRWEEVLTRDAISKFTLDLADRFLATFPGDSG